MKADLSFPYATEELHRLFPVMGNPENRIIDSVVTNSKEVRKGSLFVALRGGKTDGHEYLWDAVSKGASAVLTEMPLIDCPEGVVQFLTDDTVKALGKLAAMHKSRFGVKTVGITGSVGKTTTRTFLSSMLGSRFRVHQTEGNCNNHIGLPMTILQMPKDTEILVLEMGMNHKGEIGHLSKVAKPDVGVITNVGHAHMGQFERTEEIYSAKLEITEGIQGGVLLLPDNMYYYLRYFGLKEYLCGESESADYKLKKGASSIVFPSGKEVLVRQKSNAFPFRWAALFSAAVCDLFGFCAEETERLLPLCPFPKSRLEDRWMDGIHIIDDAYNASPESMREALLYTGQFPKRRMAFLGDMLELGTASKTYHREMGRHLAELDFDRVWLVGDYAPYTKEGAIEMGMAKKNIYIGDMESCISDLAYILQEGDTLLIKGSHGSGLWNAAEKLLEKRKKEML